MNRDKHFVYFPYKKLQLNPTNVASVMFTDEASFTRKGITNAHNNRYWAEENLHTFQSEVLFCQYLASYYWSFFARLNGQNHLEFLQNILPNYIEDVLQAQEVTGFGA